MFLTVCPRYSYRSYRIGGGGVMRVTVMVTSCDLRIASVGCPTASWQHEIVRWETAGEDHCYLVKPTVLVFWRLLVNLANYW